MGELREHWLNLRSATPSHTRLRLAALAGAGLVALSLMLAGAAGPVAWVGVLVLGALVVYQPNGAMPALFVVWSIGCWWAGTESTWHWALLPAAWGLLLVHASAALAASVPPQASLPRAVVVLTGQRVLLVGAATTVVWAVAGALVGGAGTGPGVIPGLVGLGVLAAALVAFVRLRERQAPTGPAGPRG